MRERVCTKNSDLWVHHALIFVLTRLCILFCLIKALWGEHINHWVAVGVTRLEWPSLYFHKQLRLVYNDETYVLTEIHVVLLLLLVRIDIVLRTVCLHALHQVSERFRCHAPRLVLVHRLNFLLSMSLPVSSEALIVRCKRRPLI